MQQENWVIYNYKVILAEIERTIQRDASVLDAGCGGGLVLGLLSRVSKSHHLVGIDISRDKIKTAKRRGFEVILADAHYFPFRTSSFDYSFLKDLLHHTRRPIECLKQVKQICRKNIVVEANRNNLAMILARSFHSDETHFTSRQLKSLIKHSGLQIKTFKKMHVYPFDCAISSKNPIISIWNICISNFTKRNYPVNFLKAFLLIGKALVRTPSYNIITCD